MALSNAEKVRRHRQRKKKQEIKASLELSNVFRMPFSEFFEPGRFGSDFDISLVLAGIKTPVFEDDLGARAHTRYPDPDMLEDAEIFDAATDSLGRAEFMLECLTHAASDLAGWIANYKQYEIKQRLAEIEESDMSDPTAKKVALKEATRLNKMLDQLDKQVRITFPQWKVTG
ncbi:hypothetical protein ACEUZ9_002034 [Paracoccus litorisediminis]|uniref:hypothetical protein n=1 Tax=Paracoccus litorisediminis TaxID=2006130 RepID=UPI0037337115